MPRELRPRTNRPSYVALAGYLDDDDDKEEEEEEVRPGPSSKRGKSTAFVEDDEDSESDFAPDNAEKDVVEEEVEEDMDEDTIGEIDNEVEEEIVTKPISPKRKRGPASNIAKGKMKAENVVKSVGSLSRRQLYALPTPNVHHRHRAVPLFSRVGRVERLTTGPKTFSVPSVALTNGFTKDSKVTDRVNKSWGYNIGPGPLWELVEDRGWFKEAVTSGTGVDTEEKRRPIVYPEIAIRDGWKILTAQEAAAYLPTDDVTTDEGVLKPPPPLQCYFGPIKSQKRNNLQMFESLSMSTYSTESNAHVFNAGAPVWGLDWCPIYIGDRAKRGFKQYLAIAPFPSRSHSPDIGRKVARPSYACIQIWSLSSTSSSSSRKSPSKKPDYGQMKCEMVICLDSGPAYDVKWCPLPSHDPTSAEHTPRKLGLLAGTFEDGSFSVFVIPDPKDVRPRGHDDSAPFYVNLSRPLLRIELEETACWSFDWANSGLVAIGTTNGCIAIYDIQAALGSCAEGEVASTTVTDILPTHYITVHQSAIRSLAWIRAPPSSPSGVPCLDQDPTTIASGGYDGMECMTDIREGRGVVMNRTRDVINAMAFSPFGGGPITLDHENTVKAYSASPSMLARGHSLFEPQGPVWSINASDYHPQLAVGAADGSCSTTNTLRATRRGGAAPFFVHKIFQMDYSRNAKEFRMLDHFLPQESLERPSVRSKGKGKKDNPAVPSGTGAWPQAVGIHRVVWNHGNGLAASGWLAAATASGLCRVDLLWGRWVQDKIPYGGIEGIRFEDEDAMEVDSDVSEEEFD
ncbi:unnamed protein product [Cyclocybe aegerita]|uniref:Uncharacterized protein n=1 Tax=Cyclocybe aegerita TaxID=1973307 RepID=A0A8S0X9B4_CYCAE|nr:unnamed protein product [Cyclocybe aegerita]